MHSSHPFYHISTGFVSLIRKPAPLCGGGIALAARRTQPHSAPSEPRPPTSAQRAIALQPPFLDVLYAADLSWYDEPIPRVFQDLEHCEGTDATGGIRLTPQELFDLKWPGVQRCASYYAKLHRLSDADRDYLAQEAGVYLWKRCCIPDAGPAPHSHRGR